MRRSLLALGASIAVIAGACTGGGTPAPSLASPGESPAVQSPGATGESPAATEGASAAPSFDSSAVSGTVKLSGWQSSDAEKKALQDTIAAFEAQNSKITVDYSVIAGDYPTVMATNFASRNVPDLFYVDAAFGQTWANQGFLLPLDDYISASGFDTSTFFPGYIQPFKGSDGKIYGLPKDGNTIGMAYNTTDVTTAPTTMDELQTTAQGLKGKDGLKAPMCLNASLDRGLAFIIADGGAIVSADGTQNMTNTPETTTAVQDYLNLFKNGLGMTASDMGDGWCGDSLGKKHAAIAFEGGWLDPAMSSTFPDVKYTWGTFPQGTSGKPSTISFTAAYSIGADSQNKDQAWVLLEYLAGIDGMTKWTSGGVALPSRSDVPTPQGKEVLVQQAPNAQPGSGFMKGFTDVQDAFNKAFLTEVQKKTFQAGPVIQATSAAVDKALAGS